MGLLWFCGFFNYADRQAVFSVFPLLEEEFGLSRASLGMIGSSFMVVYALMAPVAGFVVDQTSRRALVVAGLGFWSLICAATATAQGYARLLFYRAAEGLGESFYFPASMSLLADYHGPATRSRAMGLHQTSVYAGTALGGMLAGYLGQRYGWRAPFWVLGLVGMAYAPVLALVLVEPKRTGAVAAAEWPAARPDPLVGLAEIIREPAAVALLVVFAGANFVAMTLLSWLPDFIYHKFGLDLWGSATVAGLFLPAANFAGAVLGGVLADRAARRPGGRVRVQAAGLLLGAPFVYAVGAAGSLGLLVAALVGIGLCKGVYDANIFAAIYDVVPAEVRGTAAGVMNAVGWAGAALAPWLIGRAGDRVGLSRAIAATAAIYVAAGLMALVAAALAARRVGAGAGPSATTGTGGTAV